MQTKLFVLAIGCSLLLVSPTLRAGDRDPSTAPQAQPRKEAPRGPASLIPPQILEKLNLTEDQKAKLKSIEENFNKTQQEFYAAHGDEINAARQAMDKAMAGLREAENTAKEQIKALLTPEQIDAVTPSRGGARELKQNAAKPPAE